LPVDQPTTNWTNSPSSGQHTAHYSHVSTFSSGQRRTRPQNSFLGSRATQLGRTPWIVGTSSSFGALWFSCMSLGRAPFGYTANADTVLTARKERNACTNERVADGRKYSIPRLDSPFQVIGNG
jgi:hypothetical protein